MVFFVMESCSFERMYPILWNVERLSEIKHNTNYSKQKTDFLFKAEKLRNEPNITVVQKSQCLTGDPHNYESLSSYFWPNPQNPNGAYIEKDGQLNPEVNLYDRNKIDELAKRLKYFGVAYYLTRDKKYHTAFVSQMRDWFINSDSYMYPNFEYAQIIKGLNNGHGQPHGLIDAYVLTDALDAIRLVGSMKSYKRSDIKKMKAWCGEFTQWMLDSNLGKKESRQPNNHGPAYDGLIYSMADFVGNNHLCDSLAATFFERRLKTQIMENGCQPGELKRTRALHYSALNLRFVINFCKMHECKGQKSRRESIERISKALLFLYPYLDNRDAFPYIEITNSWGTNADMVREAMLRLKDIDTTTTLPNVEFDFYNNIDNWLK